MELTHPQRKNENEYLNTSNQLDFIEEDEVMSDDLDSEKEEQHHQTLHSLRKNTTLLEYQWQTHNQSSVNSE